MIPTNSLKEMFQKVKRDSHKCFSILLFPYSRNSRVVNELKGVFSNLDTFSGKNYHIFLPGYSQYTYEEYPDNIAIKGTNYFYSADEFKKVFVELRSKFDKTLKFRNNIELLNFTLNDNNSFVLFEKFDLVNESRVTGVEISDVLFSLLEKHFVY
ncbi:MAG: hypothetical protein AB7E09_07680 [Candidatus Izemoplasmatales bacterium]